MNSQLNKIKNKKNNLFNKISMKNRKNINFDKISIDNFINYIEGGYCKYSDLIQNSIYNSDISNIKFGKFFKLNGGIKPHINKIYELCLINKKYINSNNIKLYESFMIFDFIMCDKIYYSVIFINIEYGSCETCMEFEKDCKMYICSNLYDLIYYSIGNEIDKFL